MKQHFYSWNIATNKREKLVTRSKGGIGGSTSEAASLIEGGEGTLIKKYSKESCPLTYDERGSPE